ncbi:N-acetylmuramoyl-L-alanine amidase family protein [Paratissierella segnis]|uniref:N-acetylmuramoyl-L-alanine amidase n=1 Tax=Paratissierella segnis TaxID=2763679 RepID=A0A926IKQ7_9FIRM|nr:N-acetylmuramoyl-L-alanine amidase [Paratissierella segnis]MBC8589319.1 N-acetylmuramoyl-L-alanine amidase [Paratissierella segnis]
MKKVFIDAGHGGKDPGALGNGLQEKDITLSIALKIGEVLKRHNIEVVYSRTADVFLDLTTRAVKANNAKADAFVSVHVNSASNSTATGLEVWTTKGQTKGDILATAIGEQLQKDFPSIAFRKDMSDGDLDKEENFTVLAKTNMAAALVEYMFIVNPSDAQILRTKQADFAESTAKGILKYLGIQYQDSGNIIKLNILSKKVEIPGFNKNNTNYITLEGKDIPIRTVLEALGLTVTGRGNEVIAK